MFFIIQNDAVVTDKVQTAIITEIINRHKFEHSYELMRSTDFYKDADDYSFSSARVLKMPSDFDDRYKDAIPIGDVRFIEQYLQVFKGIERDNAIEVPKVLRTDEFLKRKYSIVSRDKLPRKGSFFIKDATQQKMFSYKGEVSDFLFDEMFEEKTDESDASVRLPADHLYQVSEIVNIRAEYRVYVLNRVINSMCLFAGDPLVFPDVDLIKKAVSLINTDPDTPQSYSLDLMITSRGTAITEVHNFLGVGLYTVDWDDELLYAYKHGMDYVINHNVEQTEFSNY